MSSEQFLRGVNALILDAGLGKARTRILRQRLEGKGGQVLPSLSPAATHVLVGKNVRQSRLPSLLGCTEIPRGVRVLRADWLSACLVAGERVAESKYELPLESASCSPATVKADPPTVRNPTETGRTGGGGGEEEEGCEPVVKEERVTEGETTEEEDEKKNHKVTEETQVTPDRFPTSSRRWKSESTTTTSSSSSPNKKSKRPPSDPDSDYVDSGEEEGEEGEGRLAVVDISSLPPPSKRKKRWRCEIPPSEAQTWVNRNQHITDKLEELLAVYKSSPDDKWRAMSTTKVIQAIKKHPKEITCYEDALTVPFVGKRLAQKIDEIVASGRLRRLEAVDKEKQAALSAFAKIHGVGQVLAQQFYAQGYRSVEELAASGVLNRQQRIGVKHYTHFQERMQREEVSEIEQRVRELAQQINPGLEVVTCGSYRRGKLTCGDVDILVTHSDGRSHRGVLPKLIQEGRESGFLTDDLTIHNDQNGGGKYLGVCRLPGQDRKYRRIDIYVTPYAEFPCMLLHFTGSGHFNRSIRSKADKLGMSLSEHSLNIGVIRKNGVKVFEGTPVPVFSERDVFKYLDLPYREPTERDWD